MYEVCEGLSVSYTFDLSANTALQRESRDCFTGMAPSATGSSYRDPGRSLGLSRLPGYCGNEENTICSKPSTSSPTREQFTYFRWLLFREGRLG